VALPRRVVCTARQIPRACVLCVSVSVERRVRRPRSTGALACVAASALCRIPPDHTHTCGKEVAHKHVFFVCVCVCVCMVLYCAVSPHLYPHARAPTYMVHFRNIAIDA
jgi:hypothetical protein